MFRNKLNRDEIKRVKIPTVYFKSIIINNYYN